MKKNFYALMLAGMAACAVFTACSSDDNNGGGNAPQTGVLSGDDADENEAVANLRVSRVGDYRYSYDDAGNLVSISNGSVTLRASENFKVSEKWNYGSETGEGTVVFAFAGNRVVSATVSSKATYADGDSETAAGTVTFSYNGNGQLASVSASGTESGVDEGVRYSTAVRSTATLTYDSNGRLTTIKTTETESAGGYAWTEEGTRTFSYSPSYSNPFYQYIPEFVDHIEAAEDYDFLAYVGLMGRASSALPSGYTSKYVETETGEEPHEESYSGSYYYSFNSDGTLSYANYVSYDYITVGEDDDDAAYAVSPAKVAKARQASIFNLFRSRRHH